MHACRARSFLAIQPGCTAKRTTLLYLHHVLHEAGGVRQHILPHLEHQLVVDLQPRAGAWGGLLGLPLQVETVLLTKMLIE